MYASVLYQDNQDSASQNYDNYKFTDIPLSCVLILMHVFQWDISEFVQEMISFTHLKNVTALLWQINVSHLKDPLVLKRLLKHYNEIKMHIKMFTFHAALINA